MPTGNVFETTRTTNLKKAVKFLERRKGEVATGNYVEPGKVRVSDLLKSLLDDYEANDYSSLRVTKERIDNRLMPEFGNLKAGSITTDLLNQYAAKYRQQGLSNATLNRDFAALKRAFNLAFECTPRKVAQVPKFPHFEEAPPRKGFVEEAGYKKLVDSGPELWMRSMLAIGYAFGFRVGELREMRVEQVDLLNEAISLPPGSTKNSEAREVFFNDQPEIRQLLIECVRGKQKKDYLFTNSSGRRVQNFRKAWNNFCIRAGLGKYVCSICQQEVKKGARLCCKGARRKYQGLLFHDMRRSAARNMVRRGVSETVAMTVTGHLTPSMFRRYNITDESDRREASRKIANGHSKMEDGHILGIGKLDGEAEEVVND